MSYRQVPTSKPDERPALPDLVTRLRAHAAMCDEQEMHNTADACREAAQRVELFGAALRATLAYLPTDDSNETAKQVRAALSQAEGSVRT